VRELLLLLLLLLLPTVAQKLANDAVHVAHVDRLHEMGIEAGVESALFVFDAAVASEREKEWNAFVRSGSITFGSARDFVSIETRKADIDDRDIEVFLERESEAVIAVVRALHAMTFLFEKEGDKLTRIFVVIAAAERF
jgi:hypothetical protein